MLMAVSMGTSQMCRPRPYLTAISRVRNLAGVNSNENDRSGVLTKHGRDDQANVQHLGTLIISIDWITAMIVTHESDVDGNVVSANRRKLPSRVETQGY